MEFDNLDYMPGKSWNFCPGHGMSCNLMLANMCTADLPTIIPDSKCTWEDTLYIGKTYIYYDVLGGFHDSR